MPADIASGPPIELDELPARPLVTVLMANYNYARFLPAALESVSAQAYDELEIVVCDDGSSDESRAVVREHAARDPRILLAEKPNGGYPTALNLAYERSRGEILCVLDADDLFAPNKVEAVVDALRRGAGMFTHKLTPVDALGTAVGPPLPATLDRGWLGATALARGGEGRFPPASGLSLRREVAEVIFPLPEHFRRGADGYVARAAQFLAPVASSDDVLAYYRVHGSQTTGLWSTNVASLRGFIEDNVKITAECRVLLERVYSAEVAARLADEDRPSYWEPRIALRALEGRDSVEPGTPNRAIVARIRPRSRRLIWRSLLVLPRPLARRLMDLWWGDSRLKALLRRLARGGRRGPR